MCMNVRVFVCECESYVCVMPPDNDDIVMGYGCMWNGLFWTKCLGGNSYFVAIASAHSWILFGGGVVFISFMVVGLT